MVKPASTNASEVLPPVLGAGNRGEHIVVTHSVAPIAITFQIILEPGASDGRSGRSRLWSSLLSSSAAKVG
jgi:hypothetical protein